MLKLSDFDYRLPKELIAQFPSERRDESRLLVLDRKTGKTEHRIFRDIIEYLNPGDALVLNDTKVVPARLVGRKAQTGGRIEILLLNPIDLSLLPRPYGQSLRGNPSSVIASPDEVGTKQSQNRLAAGSATEAISKKRLLRNDSLATDSEYEVLIKPIRGIKPGSMIDFGNSELKADITRIENGRIFLKFNCNGDFYTLLTKFGRTPLPPYIKREPIDSDKKRYQTIYAKKEGAIAAPTAGLHFTKNVLREIEDKGVGIECVTLHVGYGTFKPVKCEDISQHKMEEEYFEVSKKTIERLIEIKRKGGRIFVVGTTTCRVLETVCDCFIPTFSMSGFAMTDGYYQGWTGLFIYPPYKFKSVDCLITNFHLPKTTLLMLVSTFCGKEFLFRAYREAIEKGYRFYSYGDAMLIL